MRGAGRLDSTPAAIVMMRSAAKQAGFKAVSVCWQMDENKCAYSGFISFYRYQLPGAG